MMIDKPHRAVALLVACGLFSTPACDDNGRVAVPVALSTEPTASESDDLTMTEIIATDFHFNPSRIYARPGQRLRVVLRNDGSLHHNLRIALPSGERSLASDVLPGQRGEMTIDVPAEPGEIGFVCPVGNNRDVGMTGALVVETPLAVSLTEVVGGLAAPVAMIEVPDGSGRKLVVDQIGLVHVITPEGTLAPQPFLDVRDRMVAIDALLDERGLLGLALHPRFPEDKRLFIHYSARPRSDAPPDTDHTSRISELRVADDGTHAMIPTERVLLQIDRPRASHNGGPLAFGPKDGLLYASLGDGGDTGGSNLPGSILRIDIERGVPYAIPPDNPFASGGGAPEIYALGFRNPNRLSFDVDGDVARLFVTDAGEVFRAGVSLVERRGGDPLRWPVVELPHASQAGGLGAMVVGGHVYRGHVIPALAGRYVFGVWSRKPGEPSGALLVADRVAGAPATDLWPIRPIDVAGREGGTLGRFLLGFARTLDGELWVLTSDVSGPSGTTGRVFRVGLP